MKKSKNIDDMQAHQEIVDQLNQEYADSITPEYIAEQHSKQRNLLRFVYPEVASAPKKF